MITTFWLIVQAVFRVGGAVAVCKGRVSFCFLLNTMLPALPRRHKRESGAQRNFRNHRSGEFRRCTTSKIFNVKTPDIDCTSNEGKTLEKIAGRLNFENLRFSYPLRSKVEVLKGVSFNVEAGETVALVGSFRG